MATSAEQKDVPTTRLERATIPFINRRFGSWHLAISRQARTSVELMNQYDAVAKKWGVTAQRFQLETAYRDVLSRSDVVPALAVTDSDAQVLDCGVGSGSLSIALHSLRPNRTAYHGIDISCEMLETAAGAMGQVGMSPTLQTGDILSIPYADHSFDLVMAAHVLEHLPDPNRALAEMTRVLRPGGHLLVCVTRRSLFGTLIQLRWRTWAVTARLGTGWLRDCHLSDIDCHPVHLGGHSGQASLAFWGRKPC